MTQFLDEFSADLQSVFCAILSGHTPIGKQCFSATFE